MSGGRLPAPAPADFAHWATIEGWSALRTRYGKDTPTLQRWVAETGVVRPVLVGGKPRRAVPDDFVALSSQRSNVELMAIYACGSEMIYRWRRETGAKARDKMTIPEGFAEAWKANGLIQLAKQFGRHHSTISLWVKALGLSRPQGKTLTQQARNTADKTQPKAVDIARAPAPKRFIKPDAFRTAPVDRVQRDMTDAGRAADTLRRDRWTVFRCDEKGRATADGKMWLCGRVLCTPAELIERAERAARRMSA